MRVFVTQPVGLSAIERLRTVIDVDVNPDGSRIMPKSELIRAVQRARWAELGRDGEPPSIWRMSITDLAGQDRRTLGDSDTAVPR